MKGLTKVIFYYPAKGLWFLIKKAYSGVKKSKKNIKEAKQQRKINKSNPKSEAKYDPIKEVKNQKGKFIEFENKILKNKSVIGIILGARGTGKSAIGMRLLENIKAKTGKKTYALGFKPESLPGWIKSISDVSEIENNSIILIDEGGIEFSSRSSMSNANKLLSQLLLIARHKDLSVLFITQNSSNLEINAIRQADFLILKPSSLLQKDFERKKIKTIYENVEQDFENLKEDVGLTYVYAHEYQGFVSNTLPTFWSDKVSKGYANK